MVHLLAVRFLGLLNSLVVCVHHELWLHCWLLEGDYQLIVLNLHEAIVRGLVLDRFIEGVVELYDLYFVLSEEVKNVS